MADRRRLSYDATAPHPFREACVCAGPPASLEEPVPQIRPFRALRFDPSSSPTVAVVARRTTSSARATRRCSLATRETSCVWTCPRRASRGPRRAIPARGPDARGMAIRRDAPQGSAASVYVYEQTYRVPGTRRRADPARVLRGLRLEPFGPDSGVLRHERTLEGPREDRYGLLRATGVNTSPVVGLYDDPSGTGAADRDAGLATPPVADVTDDDGVRHRLWVVAGGRRRRTRTASRRSSRRRPGPVTIADGHHRYETALRYRDERRMRARARKTRRSTICSLLSRATAEPLTVLPTHRVMLGLGDDGVTAFLERLADLFDVEPARAGRAAREVRRRPRLRAAARGGSGSWTRDGGAMLDRARGAFEPTCSRRRSAVWPRRHACSASRSSGWPGSTRGRSRAAASATRSRPPRPSPGSTGAPTARRRVPARPDPGRVGRGGRRATAT